MHRFALMLAKLQWITDHVAPCVDVQGELKFLSVGTLFPAFWSPSYSLHVRHRVNTQLASLNDPKFIHRMTGTHQPAERQALVPD